MAFGGWINGRGVPWVNSHRAAPEQSGVDDAGSGWDHDRSAGGVEVAGIGKPSKRSLDVDHLVVVVIQARCGSGTGLRARGGVGARGGGTREDRVSGRRQVACNHTRISNRHGLQGHSRGWAG